MSLSISLVPPHSEGKDNDKKINCLQLLNKQLDLKDFFKLVVTIETLELGKLAEWKSEFTTKFIHNLKNNFASMESNAKMKLPTTNLLLELRSLSNFSAFVDFYDRMMHLSRVPSLGDQVETFLTKLFNFMNSCSFVISAPEKEVKAEIQQIIENNLLQAQENFIKGAIELVKTGIDTKNLMKVVQDVQEIGPSKVLGKKLRGSFSTWGISKEEYQTPQKEEKVTEEPTKKESQSKPSKVWKEEPLKETNLKKESQSKPHKEWKEAESRPVEDITYRKWKEQCDLLYQQMPQLLKEHKEKWVVFSNNKVSWITETEEEAWRKADEIKDTAVITQITESVKPEELNLLDFSRIEDPSGLGHLMAKLSVQTSEENFYPLFAVIDTGCSADLYIHKGVLPYINSIKQKQAFPSTMGLKNIMQNIRSSF